MNAVTLITSLAAQGIHLSSNGSKLRIEAPADLLTPDLRALLVCRKDELLATLKAQAAPRLLGVVEGIEWEQQHIRRARAMIQQVTRIPERAEDLYRAFAGAWSAALTDANLGEHQAVKYAFDVLNAEISHQTEMPHYGNDAKSFR